MIKLKNQAEIDILRVGGQRLAKIIDFLGTKVAPGVTTSDLDDLALELITKDGDRSAFLNYRPAGSRLAYPASLCVSVNDQIVHGIPSNRKLLEGDIVTLDLGLVHQGMFTDMAKTFPVGQISEDNARLLEVTRKALNKGIKVAVAGNTTGDIGAEVEQYVLAHGFGVVRDLAGHGVGFSVHEDPSVPNFGHKGKGDKLVPGLVIAIEPMVVAGKERTKLLGDGFTFVTSDSKMSAHFEHTIVITDKGNEILTISN